MDEAQRARDHDREHQPGRHERPEAQQHDVDGRLYPRVHDAQPREQPGAQHVHGVHVAEHGALHPGVTGVDGAVELDDLVLRMNVDDVRADAALLRELVKR